ncbi:MAG: YchF/TatD family DNA exonuclease [Desulfuromonadales bacterium]|nr:YchF/TatD family DNA exonuclease [Desulfuromonadales bacterium]
MIDATPKLVDSHAHLDNSRFTEDLDQVFLAAQTAGVRYILSIGCDLQSSVTNVDLASRYEPLYAAVGFHPHDASQLDDSALEQLRHLAQQPKVVAVGEIGLDYYRNRSPHDTQQQAFRLQIQLARELGKPVIIHDRDAHEDVLRILAEQQAAAVGGVLHCFSGDLAMAHKCLDMGFYLSFTGAITYPKNDQVRAMLRQLPLERILLETDCPYLAPQPYRGKRNEPAYLLQTAETLAEIKGLKLADVARITSRNCYDLFGIGTIETAATIAYQIRDSLYLNITNRCTNSCIFCAKFNDFVVKGHELKLDHEPDVDEVLSAIGDPTPYREIVFCGYGEPLLRLDLILAVARRLKEQGCCIRINTDGQANLVHGRNILPDLNGLVDAISVSLNAADATTYQNLCQSRFGEQSFAAVTEFLRLAKDYIPDVTATMVTYPGIDIAACEKLAKELGVAFRIREYNEVG